MPLDGWTLGYLASELNTVLTGGKIDKILQPERDEVHLVVRSGGENHRLLLSASAHNARAHLTVTAKQNADTPPMLCQLLRKHVLNGRIISISQVNGDRVLRIDISSRTELGDSAVFTLVCELMGRHSNIIFINEEGKIIDSARHITPDVSRVRTVMPGEMYQNPPEQAKLIPGTIDISALENKLIGFKGMMLSKAIMLSINGFSQVSAEEAAFFASSIHDSYVPDNPVDFAGRICEYIKRPPAMEPGLVKGDENLVLDFLPHRYATRAGMFFEKCESLSIAVDVFYTKRDAKERISQKTNTLNATLRTAKERAQRKLALQCEEMRSAESAEEHKRFGDLIVSNAHLAAPAGAKKIKLTDWYADPPVEIDIPLDETLDFRGNAQKYFKRYKKAKSAAVMAASNAEKTQKDIEYLEDALQMLSVCETEGDIDEIRAELQKSGHLRASHSRNARKKPLPTTPLLFKSSDGFMIEVGKTSQQNDRITAAADGSDMWLHAKNMPGSHVIIHMEGKVAPEITLYEAAMLAACYSKGSASSNVPVDATLRRYVKKPGGSAPGFVIYTGQTTLYVTPEAWLIEKLAYKQR